MRITDFFRTLSNTVGARVSAKIIRMATKRAAKKAAKREKTKQKTKISRKKTYRYLRIYFFIQKMCIYYIQRCIIVSEVNFTCKQFEHVTSYKSTDMIVYQCYFVIL